MRSGHGSQSKTGRENSARMRGFRATALAALLFVAPAVAAAAPVTHKEVRMPRMDRRAIENLQRWVNGGHDAWCKDAREVASMELRRVAPEFTGDRFDLASLPVSAQEKNARRAAFTWTSLDGGATYRITVRGYEWLKALAHGTGNTVWVPSRVEIVRTEQPAPPKRTFPELPKA